MSDLARAAMLVPCGNLVERDEPVCMEGRAVPNDCTHFCAYYRPGLTDQERLRAIKWALILDEVAQLERRKLREPSTWTS